MKIKNMSEILKAYDESVEWLKAEGYHLEDHDFARYNKWNSRESAKPCLIEVYEKGAYGELDFDDEFTYFNSISRNLNYFDYKKQRVFLWFLGRAEKIEAIAE